MHHGAVTQSHVSTIEQGRSGTLDIPPLDHLHILTAFASSSSSYSIKYYRAAFLVHLVSVFRRTRLFFCFPGLCLTFHMCDKSAESRQLIASVQMCKHLLLHCHANRIRSMSTNAVHILEWEQVYRVCKRNGRRCLNKIS